MARQVYLYCIAQPSTANTGRRTQKPFPPPVKVCKEIVNGMGGAQSTHYARFKNYNFMLQSRCLRMPRVGSAARGPLLSPHHS
ncbi:uncharacterized protein HD556DRAFT_486556 [Suillus plorans]|uniref:Uncharacterized protein n=1 Tax=Suillus plorans TaxID=116603 RepID=A0A9P7DWD8_9AGAM|nr:uncharacterized protein HD556DRAFT_486556 [Suillus plorans]KAG1804863.1 hypothetical protein HD556DRAFT_486556 [Suillus plorans]